jgi:hypothetical protein
MHSHIILVFRLFSILFSSRGRDFGNDMSTIGTSMAVSHMSYGLDTFFFFAFLCFFLHGSLREGEKGGGWRNAAKLEELGILGLFAVGGNNSGIFTGCG